MELMKRAKVITFTSYRHCARVINFHCIRDVASFCGAAAVWRSFVGLTLILRMWHVMTGELYVADLMSLRKESALNSIDYYNHEKNSICSE